MADSPFIRDVPAARALDAWRGARDAAGCPARLPAIRVPVQDAAGLVTAEPVWATRSSPPFDAAGMDGIAVRAADTIGASETTPVLLPPGSYDVVDTGDPMPDGRDAVVMREYVHYQGDTAELRTAAPPYQHVRSIGEDVSAAELLLPEGHRLRAVDLAAAAAAGATHLVVRRRPLVTILPTGDEVRPIGTATVAGEIIDTNSLMLATQAREAGCEATCLPIEPDVPDRIADVVTAAAADCDLLIIVAGSSAGRDDYTARVVAERGSLAVHGVAVRPGHPVVLGTVGHTPVLGAPGYPVSAALTFDIFAEPLLAELSGRAAAAAAADHGAAGPQAGLPARHGRLGPGPTRRGRRDHGRHPAAARRGRAYLAGPRGRPARRAGRPGGPSPGRAGPDRAAPRPRRDLPDHRGHRLARPRPGPGRVSAARRGPAGHPGLVERRLAGRPGRAPRRAVPPGRIPPAGPGHRRVHAALPGPHPRRHRGRRGPAAAP